MHYSLMEKTRLPFIDSDLLYRGTLYGKLTVFKFNAQEQEYLTTGSFDNRDFFSIFSWSGS